MIDVIIIGAGPAGVTAALYLKRLRKNVIVFTTNTSVLEKAHIIDNYYGISSIKGSELYERGIKQLADMEIPIYEAEVLEINKKENFSITTTGSQFESKTVIIATGASRTGVNIKNLSSFEGTGVSYCATCDGFFFKEKKIAVIGNKDFALHEANYLLNVTKDVTIFTNGMEISDGLKNSSFKIITSKISEIKKENNLIIVADSEYEVDGIFVALGVAGSSSFAKKLGLEMNGSYLKVNENYETYIEGLYAIGDCIGGLLQISKAMKDGAESSIFVNKYLNRRKS